MAQYKVPQDVEADDKLLGPFSFRQFVYLMIAGGLLAVAAGLFQLFPLLAIIPLPPALFFIALALPLKKDQPMETYLAAIVSYHLKQRTRVWMPGQEETAVQITAPKKVEESRTRDITGEEATHRLSFLADIVDTEGYAIKGINTNPMREDLIAEASTVVDMFEGTRFNDLDNTIQRDEQERHEEMIKHMQQTIEEQENWTNAALIEEQEKLGPRRADQGKKINPEEAKRAEQSAAVVVPEMAGERTEAIETVETVETGEPEVATESEADIVEGVAEEAVTEQEAERPPMPMEEVKEKPRKRKDHKDSPVIVLPDKPVENSEKKAKAENEATKMVKPSIIELAHNDAFSVATIAKQAERVKRKEEGEIFISLH